MSKLLIEIESTAFDSAGDGIVSLGPQDDEVWFPVEIRVSTNQRKDEIVKEATCSIFIGENLTDLMFRDATHTGSSGDAYSVEKYTQVIMPGKRVFAVWSGGDSGAQGVLIVAGTKDAENVRV